MLQSDAPIAGRVAGEVAAWSMRGLSDARIKDWSFFRGSANRRCWFPPGRDNIPPVGRAVVAIGGAGVLLAVYL